MSVIGVVLLYTQVLAMRSTEAVSNLVLESVYVFVSALLELLNEGWTYACLGPNDFALEHAQVLFDIHDWGGLLGFFVPGFQLRQFQDLIDFEVLTAQLMRVTNVLRSLAIRKGLLALLPKHILSIKFLRSQPLILLAFYLDPIDALAGRH